MSRDESVQRALREMRHHFVCFSRNGRWGTCGFCPRTSEGDVFPEFCAEAERGDHWLTLASLVEQYEHRRRSTPMTTRDAIELAADVLRRIGDPNRAYVAGEREIESLARALLAEHEQNAALVKRVAELEDGLAMAIERGNCLRAWLYTSAELAELGDDATALRTLLARKERGE